jgi:hypothetical protein
MQSRERACLCHNKILPRAEIATASQDRHACSAVGLLAAISRSEPTVGGKTGANARVSCRKALQVHS